MTRYVDSYNIVLDVEGIGLKNFNLEFTKSLLRIL